MCDDKSATLGEVCTDYTCSLHKLRRGFENRKRKHCFYFVYLGILIDILCCSDGLP